MEWLAVASPLIIGIAWVIERIIRIYQRIRDLETTLGPACGEIVQLERKYYELRDDMIQEDHKLGLQCEEMSAKLESDEDRLKALEDRVTRLVNGR